MPSPVEVMRVPDEPDVLHVYRGIIYDWLSSKILFVQRSSEDTHRPGEFEFPGGKIDKGEKPIGVLTREVKEETGLIIAPLVQESVEASEIYVEKMLIEKGRHKGKLHIGHFILSRVVGGSLELSSEHDDAIWTEITMPPTFGPITPDSEEAYRQFRMRWGFLGN